MKQRLLLVLFCTVGFQAAALAQDLSAFEKAAWAAIAKPGSTIQWLKLNDDTHFTAKDFFSKNKIALGLTDADEMLLTKTEADELGMTHYRFQQFSHNIKVYGAEYILHEKEGRIIKANGKLVRGLAPPAPLLMAESAALDVALALIPGKNYRWLSPEMEALLKKRQQNQEATFFPKGELVWLKVGSSREFVSENISLAWKFDIYTMDANSASLFIDPQTGNLLKRIPLAIVCNHQAETASQPTKVTTVESPQKATCDAGSGTSIWNGVVGLNTSQSGGQFILLDDCQAPNIRVLNGNLSSNPQVDATDYTDADNIWGTEPSGVQAFFGMRQTRAYYFSTFGRSSYGNDVNGIPLDILVDNNVEVFGSFANACWGCYFDRFSFGDHDGTGAAPTDNDWNTLDIVGHEFTHAVTEYSANLVYSGESGALNESFSDIFGEMVELFTESSADWLIGNDRIVGGVPDPLRSFSNPSSLNDAFVGLPYPDTYLGPNWDPLEEVHHNSSVQNHWFYLLSVGGAGVNDFGTAFAVSGIGANKAAAIAYRNLTLYLSNSSDYADAQQGAIEAAIDLYGNCSDEVLQCARAWNAVGLNTVIVDLNLVTNCAVINATLAAGQPYRAIAFNDLESDCNIPLSSLTLPNFISSAVVFEADHSIRLKPGFSSARSFHARIFTCGSHKPSPVVIREIQAQNTQHSSSDGSIRMDVFPNPFDATLSVQFDLFEPTTHVSLSIFDAFGRQVHQSLNQEPFALGEHTVQVDNLQLPPGLYYITLSTSEGRWVQKVVKGD